MKIALLGTRGVPARYGGFESCVEEVGTRLASRGHEVLVYSRSSADRAESDEPSTYRGMQVIWLPAAHTRALETLSHTTLSVTHLLREHADTDAAVMFNAANAPLLPALRTARIPVATHVDGLEWKRGKWGGTGRHYYRQAESLAVRWSDALIADAPGIQDYYRATFDAPTTLISYGAPIVPDRSDRIAELDLAPHGYHLVVARFEPENHVTEIVEGYVASGARRPLVVVGSAPYAEEYTRRVHAAADDRVRFLGATWDQELLDQLYANALTYLHGHSVGGTNPSLLRAMGAGAPTIAYDVVFNRDVLGHTGLYFQTAQQLSKRLREAESNLHATGARGEASRRIALSYDWDDVADAYERLAESLHRGTYSHARPSGIRRTDWRPETSTVHYPEQWKAARAASHSGAAAS